jgi:hypothetical protein
MTYKPHMTLKYTLKGGLEVVRVLFEEQKEKKQ